LPSRQTIANPPNRDDGEGFVFTKKNGRPIVTFRKRWHSAVRAIGVPNSAHIETLIIPALLARAEYATVTPHGWRQWAPRRMSIRPVGAVEPHRLAAQLAWSLERACERRQDAERRRGQHDVDAANTLNHAAATGPRGWMSPSRPSSNRICGGSPGRQARRRRFRPVR